MPRKDGNEMELLGQDISHCSTSHNRLICCVGKDTLCLEMSDVLAILNEVHMFTKKARKHYRLESVSGINSEV